MKKELTFAKGSDVAIHASVDQMAFYGDILHLIPSDTCSVIIDYGAGMGAAALAFYNYGDGFPEVFAVDPDPEMRALSQEFFADKFEYLDSREDYECYSFANPPYYITDSLPDLSDFKNIIPGLKADFALCNAVMMFIEPDKRETSLLRMLDDLNPGGHLVVRYRTIDLKEGMKPISVSEMTELALKFNSIASVIMTDPIPDPQNRHAPNGDPYLWHQQIFKKFENS